MCKITPSVTSVACTQPSFHQIIFGPLINGKIYTQTTINLQLSDIMCVRGAKSRKNNSVFGVENFSKKEFLFYLYTARPT